MYATKMYYTTVVNNYVLCTLPHLQNSKIPNSTLNDIKLCNLVHYITIEKKYIHGICADLKVKDKYAITHWKLT